MDIMDSEEIDRLREQVRLLTSENNQLRRDNNTLNERLSSAASRVSKAAFTLTAAPSATDTQISTEPIMMGGVEVKMFGSYMLDNEGARQFFIWFELTSPTLHDAVILPRISYRVAGGNQEEPVTAEILQSGGGSPTLSTMMPAKLIKNTKSPIAVTVHVKLIKTEREESSISFSDRDEMAQVKIHNEIIPVNVSYLSAWSEYFRGYFASTMRESRDGLYPVEDCEAAEFQEMLDVIYPSWKPISQWNVKSLIRLADRFIMPSLSRKCEVFLTNRSKHNLTDAELLKIADEYRLEFTKAIVLECTSADQLHKNVIAKEEYKSYSEELKKAIDTRYVESKVPERNKC